MFLTERGPRGPVFIWRGRIGAPDCGCSQRQKAPAETGAFESVQAWKRSIPGDDRAAEPVVHADASDGDVVVVREVRHGAVGREIVTATHNRPRDGVVAVSRADVKEFGAESPIAAERPLGAEAGNPAPGPVVNRSSLEAHQRKSDLNCAAGEA